MPDAIRSHYFKLKIVEIFLLLSVISTESHEKRGSYRKQQVDIVKAVGKYLSKNFVKRITIDDLSRDFDVPASTLKRCFKGVYGVTIHQFINSSKSAVLMRRNVYYKKRMNPSYKLPMP